MRVSVWFYLLEQSCAGLCILWTVGASAGLSCRVGPMALAALLGGMASAMCASAPGWLRLTALLLTACCAPALGLPGLPRRLRLRAAVSALLLTLLLSGLMRMLSLWALPPALTALAACMALRTLPVVVPRQELSPQLATVDVRLGPHHVSLTALIDSGNLLRDPLTRLPVVVVSRRTAQRLIALPPDGSLAPGMRLIPVRTVSGTGMMAVFRPDSLCILLRGAWQQAPAMVGVSPDGYDGFQALIPASLLTDSAALPLQTISEGG